MPETEHCRPHSWILNRIDHRSKSWKQWRPRVRRSKRLAGRSRDKPSMSKLYKQNMGGNR
nr:MAG TPA: hypothetical protein [Caudoviricetes sp.]